MALESATYISDLNSSNPAASDAISTADDHLRLIKSTIKATFPNIDGPVALAQDEFAPLESPVFTGTPEAPTADPGTDTEQIATTAFVHAERTNTATLTNKTLTSPTINGGSVSGITDLAVADGGTGASTAADARTNLGVPSTTGSGASGTWGISITGTASNGGVTSVNGQTGAVTTTAFGDIGSYIVAGSTSFTTNVTYDPGGTYAGSSLVHFAPYGGYGVVLSGLENGGLQASTRNDLVTSTSYGLSGTWRLMTKTRSASAGLYPLGLFVRIS